MAKTDSKVSRPRCFITVDVAQAVNHFLYGVVGKHENPGFKCPGCDKAVEPVKPRKRGNEKRRLAYFRHVKKSDCEYYK
jgi:hypothetical protein